MVIEMKILMVGGGKGGSFEIRGRQLGAALGARVVSALSEADLRWADVVVLVKRAGLQWAKAVHAAGKPLVWDALDCWPQPAMHRCTDRDARAWLMSQIAVIRPTVTIGATQAMADACGGVYVPHHSWPGLVPTPARENVQTVAYQGNPAYLGTWAGAITVECKKRGWTFAINPPDLRQADILVAFRDGQWDGWICRQWKSGVKIVNAICAGRPILTQPGAAGDELRAHGAVLDDMSHLGRVFDFWASESPRRAAVQAALERVAGFHVREIAARYQAILADRVVACAR